MTTDNIENFETPATPVAPPPTPPPAQSQSQPFTDAEKLFLLMLIKKHANNEE